MRKHSLSRPAAPGPTLPGSRPGRRPRTGSLASCQRTDRSSDRQPMPVAPSLPRCEPRRPPSAVGNPVRAIAHHVHHGARRHDRQRCVAVVQRAGFGEADATNAARGLGDLAAASRPRVDDAFLPGRAVTCLGAAAVTATGAPFANGYLPARATPAHQPVHHDIHRAPVPDATEPSTRHIVNSRCASSNPLRGRATGEWS